MTGFVAPDFENEPVPGLPGPLPEGEYIVWQGTPSARLVARHTFKARWIAAYFGVFLFWMIVTGIYFDRTAMSILVSLGAMLLGAVIVLGFIWAFSWGVEKTTMYTITNRRVVMRFGIALPTSFNLPFAEIVSADAIVRDGGDGNIALKFNEDVRLSWAVFWPHVRGFRMARTEPQLICLPDAQVAADKLSMQLHAYLGHMHVQDEQANAVTFGAFQPAGE